MGCSHKTAWSASQNSKHCNFYSAVTSECTVNQIKSTLQTSWVLYKCPLRIRKEQCWMLICHITQADAGRGDLDFLNPNKPFFDHLEDGTQQGSRPTFIPHPSLADKNSWMSFSFQQLYEEKNFITLFRCSLVNKLLYFNISTTQAEMSNVQIQKEWPFSTAGTFLTIPTISCQWTGYVTPVNLGATIQNCSTHNTFTWCNTVCKHSAHW